MAIIKYERGADGVVRESVSNDGGKTFSQTGANSSNGYSGSSSSKKPASTSSNKNTGNSSNKNTGNSGYSGYTQDQYNNQSAYLDNMINTGTAGQKAWAQAEKDKLNSQYGGNNNANNGGNNGYWHENPDGSGTQYNNVDTGTWDTSGQKWTNVGGTQGVNYAISGDNGTIITTDSNGVQTRFLPTSADYNSFFNNMMNDIKAAGNSYTPHYTFGVDADLDGQQEYHDTKAYTWGNADLQYALQQAAKENPGLSVEDYVKSFYDRIGQANAAGDGTVTVPSVDAELDRLGLSDWNSQNAILTAGQTLLPGNEFVTIGPDKTGDEGTWGFYGGQQYRLDGDLADFVEYVNGKTGNLNNNLSYIFGDMANNPYAQQDPAFMQQYQQGQSQFNNANGSITGNTNVDNVINYVNSLNNYNQAIGGNSGSSLLEMLQGYLNSGLQANQDFIAQQRAMAEQQAQRQASDAYVNMVLAGDAAKEQMSALGLGTTGALQSALMGVQGNYSNNLATIDQNLATMLNGLSEQELQVLTDYYNNMANYAYQVTNDEADRALQQAQLALQQQQAAYDQQYQAQQLAMQQAQWEWQKQQAAYEQEQNQKLQQAAYYQSMYDNGSLSDAGLVNALSNLGLISGGYWPNGSYTNGSTIGQAQRQQAALDLQNAQLQNDYLQAQTNWMNRR